MSEPIHYPSDQRFFLVACVVFGLSVGACGTSGNGNEGGASGHGSGGGAWQHPPYFHDGSAATLEAVVETYNRKRNLGFNAQEVRDLAQYVRSL